MNATGLIAFTRYDAVADRGDGFTIAPDGSNRRSVGTGDISCGSWSPDGLTVLCSAWFAHIGARPATANADGTDFMLLDAYPGLRQSLICTVWAAEGTRFLCTDDWDEDADPSLHGLYTVRASDGGGLARVTVSPPGCSDNQQVLSPDGSHIVFDRVCGQDEHGILYAIDLDGGDAVQLSPSALFIADPFQRLSAAWSPDGTQVAFGALVPAADSTALYVVNADGTGLRQIVSTDVGAVSARWSPDGGWIALTSRFRSQPQVWRVHPDGSGLQRLTDGADGSTSVGPIWSPDGTRLLYSMTKDGRDSLWIMNRDGTGRSQLSEEGGADWLDWGPPASPGP